MCDLFVLAMEAHCVDSEEILDVELMDEYRMVINDENVNIIHQFKNCSHFYVEVCLKYRHTDVDILAEVNVIFLRNMFYHFTIYNQFFFI